MSNGNNAVISCLSSDDEDDNDNGNDLGSQKENIENEIEVVDKAHRATTNVVSNRTTNDDGDEELQIVGTANEQRFPHSRQDCLEFRYTADNDNHSNAQFCKLCYCYVCDKPASECDNWFRGEKGVCSDAAATTDDMERKAVSGSNNNKSNPEPYKNHCHATDRGSQLWKNMRQAVKDGRDPSQVFEREEGTAGGIWSGHIATTATTQRMEALYASLYGGVPPAMVARAASRGRARHRIPATARGGARQRRSVGDGRMSSSPSGSGVYGSVAYAAASGQASPSGRSRSRSANAAAAAAAGGRRRNRPSSASQQRPAPHDHRRRIRTQQLLEDLYK